MVKNKKKYEEPEELLFQRNSESQSFRGCRQSWYWSYVQHLKPNKPSPPLELGTIVHEALRKWYPKGLKRGVDPVKTVRRLYKESVKQYGQEIYMKSDPDDVDDHGVRITIGEMAEEMMKNYLDEYGDDDWFEVIAPEQLFQVDVYDPVSGVYALTAVGQIDLVIRDRRTRKLGFLEHKTGATLQPFGAPEPLDEQSGTYWTYGPAWLKHTGQIDERDSLDFIMFNRLRKSFADTRPKNDNGYALNKDGTISKRQPLPLFKRSMVFRSEMDQYNLDRRIRAISREMQMVREGKLMAYKTPGRHCGYCGFRDPCEVHESGGDWQSVLDAMFYVWDPYEEHRKGKRVGETTVQVKKQKRKR